MRADSDVERIVQALPALPERGDEFGYASAPLCVLDAVFSIGVRYESVRALMRRYADHYGLPLHRAQTAPPSERDQATVSDLVGQIEALGPERFAVEVVENRCRTSSRGGILKAEALVKPDRMIMRFLERVLGRRVGVDEAQDLLTEAARALDPPASVGAVDYAIWQHERQRRVTAR